MAPYLRVDAATCGAASTAATFDTAMIFGELGITGRAQGNVATVTAAWEDGKEAERGP